jgi:hypothetical protein
VKKAWRTRWNGVDSIVAAETAAKAKHLTVIAAREAYSRREVKFTDVLVRRAPKHDPWAELDSTGTLWDEQYLPRPNA